MQPIDFLYKPILPHQMRQFWEAGGSYRLTDFNGQKFSYFFSRRQDAAQRAAYYARELGETCYVMSLLLNDSSREYFEMIGETNSGGSILGIAVETLEQCFPQARKHTRIITACVAEENQFATIEAQLAEDMMR